MQVLWKYDTVQRLLCTKARTYFQKIRYVTVTYEDKVETFTINNVFMICTVDYVALRSTEVLSYVTTASQKEPTKTLVLPY
jgi:hypothetical protein